MNKLICFPLAFLLLCGCSNSNDCKDCDTSKKLVSPTFSVTDASSQSPVTGLMYVYPCNAGTSTYFGNYSGEPPTIQSTFGYYLLKDGNITPGVGYPLLLPSGLYELIYWVEGYTPEPIYSPAIIAPQPSVGSNLEESYFALRPYSLNDTLYMPVYDYIFAQKEVNIGIGTLDVPMRRVVSGLKVIVKKNDDTALDESIDSIQFYISGVAEKLNLYTAEATDLSKTVMLDLTISADRMTASNNAAMLFPTVPTPPVTVVITMKSGQKLYYRTNLTNTPQENNNLTVTINIGVILESPSGGGFEVPDWTESQETINAGNAEQS